VNTPLRYDGVTMICPVCEDEFAAQGRRRYCSDACKQKAWRQRLSLPAPVRRARRTEIVYACPACETRYLGERRCPDCNLFTRSLGPGAPCAHCNEPIAITDIIDDYQATQPRRPR
jgi:hypothetical protein